MQYRHAILPLLGLVMFTPQQATKPTPAQAPAKPAVRVAADRPATRVGVVSVSVLEVNVVE